MTPRARSLALLRERVASLPAALLALPEPAALGGVFRDVRGVVSTGVGSSAAHARFLAARVGEAGALAARFVPLGGFPREHAARHAEDALVVFSQGLSPNAQLALALPSAWRRVVLVSCEAAWDAAKRAFAAAFRAAGGVVVESGGDAEYGTLVRVVGPLLGYAAAQRLAAALGAEPLPPGGEIAEAVAAALGRGARIARELGAALLTQPLLLVAHGGYAELCGNLRLKLVEGLLRPVPPVCELLEFAHGPYQQLHAEPALLLALCGPCDAEEAERLERASRMLEPRRHRLVRLPATLPGPLAIFEHEALLDALLLAAAERSELDLGNWPGRSQEHALYALGAPAPAPAARVARSESLASLVWPEFEARVAAGARLAVLPLGSTEQHGPHLPFATDSWIAEALATRVCARLPDAFALPALPLGCAPEHLGFPGTLSLSEETLAAVLREVAASLARAGVREIFCFSAHGGNLGLLRARAEDLAAAAAPARWIAFTDSDRLSESLSAVSAAFGVSAAEAGEHAGELETSLLLALRPAAVRRDRFAPGRMTPAPAGASLFYPDLRANAPSGVVGDPSRAASARAEAYLAAWTEVLVAACTAAMQTR